MTVLILIYYLKRLLDMRCSFKCSLMNIILLLQMHISILKLHKTESRTKRPLNRDYFVAALFFFSLIPSTEHKT